MNRLQKRCFFAATGFHLLLLVILVVGPAFLASKDDADHLQVLEFVPMMTTDKPFSGGGNPKATPPPPAPVQQPPQLQPQPQATPPPPSPPPEVKKATPPPEPVKTDADALEPAKDKKRKIEVSTRLVNRRDVKTTSKNVSSTTSAAEARAAAARASAFKAAASQLREGLSSSTQVEVLGPGGGGPTYARFKDALYTAYMNAWNLPSDLEANAPSVEVRITVALDGTVVSARITKPSGIPSLDRSVQDALDRVKYVAPLPEGSGPERVCPLKFNPLAKQSLG